MYTMRKFGASSAPLSRHVWGMSDESDRGCLMNRIGDDFLTGEKTVSVGRSRRRFARRHATVHGQTHHKIAAGAGERLRGDSASGQSDSFTPFPPSSAAFNVLNARGDASGGGVGGRGVILGGPRTVTTPLCGVSYVHFSQQGTVLCVRGGAFRVEHRVVL